MKRRILVIFMTFLCLFSFLCFCVSAAVSVPEGYDVRLSLRSYVNLTTDSNAVFSSLYPSPNVQDVSVQSGSSLNSTLIQLFSDFDLVGYWNFMSYKTTRVSMQFNFAEGYNAYYVVWVAPVLRNVTGSRTIFDTTMSSADSYKSTQVGLLNWSEVYSGGPSVRLQYYTAVYSSPVITISSTFNYNSSDWGFGSSYYSGNFSMPLFAPLCFTTQEAADEFVRDSLGSIASGVDDVNSRLDDFYEGLFSYPEGWEDYYESVAAGISDQASLENSVDQEANSIIQDGLGDYDLDVSGVQSGIYDALGDDPGGSEFIHFFQWLWTINPLLPIEVGLVILFFAVFLLIRTYP